MARSRARARVACSAQGQPWGKMQSEPARRAGEPSGQREESSPQGLGGHQLLAQTDARRPTGQIMRQHLDGQPGGIGDETA